MRWMMASLGLSLAAMASAAPTTLVHQGRLVDAAGEPVSGTVQVRVGLYASATGETAEWSETQTVPVDSGYYSVVLGDQNDLGAVDFAGTELWVGVAIGDGDEIGAREPLRAVPVALSVAGGGLWATVDGGIQYSEGSVTIGGSAVYGSAALAVDSTTQGLLPPRLTTAQRDAIASPVEGLIIYNTSVATLQVFDGAGWSGVGSAAPSSAPSGQLVAWGNNAVGELGNGTTTASRVPNDVSLSGVTATLISSRGYTHGTDGTNCAITDAADLYCWGYDYQVPDGLTGNVATPVEVGRGFDWIDVRMGTNLAACGVTADHTGWCWGGQDYGALGDGAHSTGRRDAPNQVIGGVSWKSLSTGGRYNTSSSYHFQFTCGVSTDTTGPNGYCWGRDDYGVLGNDAAGGDQNYTDPVAGLLPNIIWQDIVTSEYHVCGIDTAGQAYCWGDGANGALGYGSTSDTDVPTPVSGSHVFQEIAVGQRFACALDTDQRAWCWGQNNEGQLGNGTTTNQNDPVPVAGGHRFTTLDAGQIHICALDTAGQAWCWGRNDEGQIGDGTTSDAIYPTQVQGAYRYSDIACGNRHTAAIAR